MGEQPSYRTVSLTADEVMILADRVQNHEVGSEPHTLQAFPLLIRMGSAYVEMFGDGERRAGEVPVSVSEAEAWLLRSKVSSGDKSPSDPRMGIKLLVKLYRLLLAFNSMDIGDLPPVGGVDDEMTDDRKNALNRYLGN